MHALLRTALLASFASLALVSCGPTDGVTQGCASGNRSQCLVQGAVGDHFACGLLADHTVWCWGRNDISQLGYSSTDLCPEDVGGGMTRSVSCHTFPFRVNGLDAVSRIAAGDSFVCALRQDGAVYCWGANDAGQLGNGSTLPSMAPVAVQGLTHATALAVGARHACAVSNTGVSCWGANDRQQLGGAVTQTQCMVGGAMIPCSQIPVPVSGLGTVTDLALGESHSCARTSEGRVLCWGDNRWGQLGVGMATAAPTPAGRPAVGSAHPITNATTVSSGPNHVCVLRDDGSMWCWGRNDHGELGVPVQGMAPDGCMGPCSPQAVMVPGLPGAPSPMGGMDAGMMGGTDGGTDGGAMRDGGTGVDGGTMRDAGTMGDGGMAGPMGPQAIATGGTFSCARLADGTVRCWGEDAQGQLGDGQTSQGPQGLSLVIAMPGAALNNPLQSVTSLSAGGSSTCALLGDGSLRCWGANQDGALGNGNFAQQGGPVPVSW